MAFRFPTVYDALYAHSVAEKKTLPLIGKIEEQKRYMGLAKEQYNELQSEYDKYKVYQAKRLRNEKREAYFLGTGTARPYTAEIIPFEGGNFNPESTKGLIISAKTQEALVNEIEKTKIGEKPILFPTGAYKTQKKVGEIYEARPTTRATKVNRTNYQLFMGDVGVGEKEFVAEGNLAKVIFGQKDTSNEQFSRITRSQIFGEYK